MFVLAVTGVIFVIVFSLARLRGREVQGDRSGADREPAQVYGSTQIELAWTVIPVLIVVVLFLATARVIHAIQDAPKPPTALEVTAIGHQFWWEFRYPKLGIVTANELHIPVSDRARPTPTFLKLLSADTDHSFWIPQLAGKTDLIPNRVNEMWMDPERPGRLPRPVRAVLRDAAREDAAARRRRQRRGLCGMGSRAAAARGPGRRRRRRPAGLRDDRVHQLPRGRAARSANGRFGPDLTHLMSRQTIASGAAENTSANLRLVDPGPGCHQARVADAGHAAERRGSGRAGPLSGDAPLSDGPGDER